MKRDYTSRHRKLLENLAHQRTTSWGIDGYALSFNYVSDVFHVIANKGTNDFDTDIQQTFIHGEYKVTNKSNRVGMLLEGPSIKAYYEDMPEYQPVKGHYSSKT